MAISLKPTLTLESTGGSTGVSEDSSLSLSVTNTLTVKSPFVGISKITCTADGTDTEILPSVDVTRYVYIKNTGLQSDGTTATADGTTLKVETANGYRIIDLAADEFCYFPHHAEAAGILQLEASADTIIAEYGYWTKA
tara:strand:- start:457 stop:873 length:417 start_codon:yes stop_codon:yes gene_type:complete